MGTSTEIAKVQDAQTGLEQQAPANAITLGQTDWTHDQRTVLANMGCAARTAGDWALFLFVCQRTQLDPFARQIYMVNYGGEPTIQTGIDGYRVIADRVAADRGIDFSPAEIEWCGPDGVWTDVWLAAEPPAAARATLHRDGKPIKAIALYKEYVGRKRSGEVNSMWKTMPSNQLGKCAEAAALRRAFPQDMAGVYITEEMTKVTQVPADTADPTQPPAKTPRYYMGTLRLNGEDFKGFSGRVLGRDPGAWKDLSEDDQQLVLAALDEWEQTGSDPTIIDAVAVETGPATEAEPTSDVVDVETGEIFDPETSEMFDGTMFGGDPS